MNMSGAAFQLLPIIQGVMTPPVHIGEPEGRGASTPGRSGQPVEGSRSERGLSGSVDHCFMVQAQQRDNKALCLSYCVMSGGFIGPHVWPVLSVLS